MCFRFLQVMWRFLRTGYVPHQGHGIEYEEPHDKAPLGGRSRSARRRDDDAVASHRQADRAPRSPRSSFGDNFTAALIVVIPIALALVCFAARLDIIELSHTVRAELLFALLLGADGDSGMPISIALGLSVLTYLFILSDVDPKMVGLKLFTSIDRFEIMAIPFFILAGNFLTAGGVARRMIDFATSMIGHWYGGLGLAGVVACALFAAISGSSVATVVGIGSIILPAIDGERLSAALLRRRDRDLGRARHPVPAVDQPRHLSRWRPAACSRTGRPAPWSIPPRSASCSSPRWSPG